MNPNSVIVIGAGIGGLTAAIHLARQGWRVKVVEKNAQPGGRCGRLSRAGHHFDTGPTLLVMYPLYAAEFAALGTSLHQALHLQRVDPTYHLIFDDGHQLALTSDLPQLQAQLEAIEPGSFQGWLRYMAEGGRHYQHGIEQLVYPDFRKATDFFKLSNLPLLYQVHPLIAHYANMAHYFTHPRLKAAFTFQDMYMGLSPFEAPATFSLMPYTELVHGVWYPQGGMYQVVLVLMALAQAAGVEFSFNAAVEQITIQGHRAQGVVVNGQHLAAAVVLANADLPYVYQQLLPPNRQAQALAHKRYSCSVISFFWGVDKPYPQLNPHTLFLADDYRENFARLTCPAGLPANPSLYIHAPARLDPAMAPLGQDTLIAIVPVGHLSEAGVENWGAIRDQARQSVFQRLQTLGIQDLAAHLKFEINYTPLSWRKRYNLLKGATHGLCHTLLQLGYFRPDFQHPDYPNLYFVGASTRPGTGLPTAMVAGRQVAQRIMGDFDLFTQLRAHQPRHRVGG